MLTTSDYSGGATSGVKIAVEKVWPILGTVEGRTGEVQE